MSPRIVDGRQNTSNIKIAVTQSGLKIMANTSVSRNTAEDMGSNTAQSSHGYTEDGPRKQQYSRVGSGDADRPLSEQWRLVAKKWCAADAAASLLESTKSAFLAKQMAALGDMPVSRAEMMVKSSDEWAAFVQTMVRAREEAALLKAQLEFIKMQFMEQQSANATARIEMKL